jgi:pyrrolidone-carboxylate peptidase
LSDEVKASESLAEQSATTQPSVVAGLGYPNGREETSPEPTGWQVNTVEVTTIEKQVSRETSR